MLKRMLSAGAAAIALIGFATAASGHALMLQKDVQAGAWHVMKIGLPHGCAGSPTTGVRIKIPDGIVMVRPQVKPGWTLSTTMRKMDQPITSEGVTYTESIDEIIWQGGNVGDLEFDTFEALIKFPNTPDATLYFKTVQECEEGVNRWVEIPEGGKKWGEYKHPAPFVRLYGDSKAQEARAAP